MPTLSTRRSLRAVAARAALMHLSLLAVIGAATSLPAAAAEAFAPTGSRATLNVEYVFESHGKSADKYEALEWSARRVLKMSAQLSAQPPSPILQFNGGEAAQSAQTAEAERKGAKREAMAQQMAPTTAGVEKIFAACGEDDACLAREMMKFGAAMQGTPAEAASRKTGREMAQMATPISDRYQVMRATALQGSYAIDDKLRVLQADPMCAPKPQRRCTRDEVRKGAGRMPMVPAAADPVGAAGFAAIEIDVLKNTLAVQLPVPPLPLPVTETVTTDAPGPSHGRPMPAGAVGTQARFRVSADGNSVKAFTVPVKGGWRNQSGEFTVALAGTGMEAGQLTVRWRLSVP